MSRFKTSIMLWGSPKVLKAQYNFENYEINGVDILDAVDNLYRAIREDVGLSNKGLKKRFLVNMQISNPETTNREN